MTCWRRQHSVAVDVRRDCGPGARCCQTGSPRPARHGWRRTGPRSGPCSCAGSVDRSRDRRRPASSRVWCAPTWRQPRSPRQSDPPQRYIYHIHTVNSAFHPSGVVLRTQGRHNKGCLSPPSSYWIMFPVFSPSPFSIFPLFFFSCVPTLSLLPFP